jgi:hypothetical protein
MLRAGDGQKLIDVDDPRRTFAKLAHLLCTDHGQAILDRLAPLIGLK